MKKKGKKKWNVADVIFWLVLIIVSLTCLFPFIHVFSISISDEASVIANKVILLPKGLNLSAYYLRSLVCS